MASQASLNTGETAPATCAHSKPDNPDEAKSTGVAMATKEAVSSDNTDTMNVAVSNSAVSNLDARASAASVDDAKKLGDALKKIGGDSTSQTNEGDKENENPQTKTGETSPPSPKTRSQLRAENHASPLAAKSVGNPLPGFGAVVRNAPPRITTQCLVASVGAVQANSIREPMAGQQLPSISEMLRNDSYKQVGLRPDVRHQRFDNVSTMSQRSDSTLRHIKSLQPARLSGTLKQGNVLASVFASNPYRRRADEIGPQHGIPGIGHLGDMLAPLGWNMGDEPINEASVRRIYDGSRAHAKQEVDEMVGQPKNLSAEDETKLDAERNFQWNKQLKLDDFLLQERISIYRVFEQYKREQSRALASVSGASQRLPQVQASTEPAVQPSKQRPIQSSVQTPVQSSFQGPVQQKQQQQALYHPNQYVPSTPLSAGALYNRLQQLKQDIQFPRSPMNPSMLDPRLVPQTLAAVDEYYTANQNILCSLAAENENYWRTSSANFGRPVDTRQSRTGLSANPNMNLGGNAQLQAFVSPTQLIFPNMGPGNYVYGQPGSSGPYAFNPPKTLPGPSGLNQQFGAQDPQVQTTPASNQQQLVGTANTQQNNHAARSPKKHKRAGSKTTTAQKKKDKPPGQFELEISLANLPTSVISEEALEAGRRFIPNQTQRSIQARPQAPTESAAQRSNGQHKSRRAGKPIINPAEGFPISTRGADLLIAAGARDGRNDPRSASRTSSIAPRTETSNTQETIQNSSETGTFSSHDSESNNDPDDSTVGRRTSRKVAKGRTASSASKRRASITSEPANKRSRNSKP